MLIIVNTSVKNNIATLTFHVCKDYEIITKSVHYTINITFIEAKLFTIKCRINHAVQL